MPEDAQEVIIQGAAVWNAWVEENRSVAHSPHFARPNWYRCVDEHGRQIKGANSLNFDGVHLSHASVHAAFAEGLSFCDATITGCYFDEGDFSRANFSGTTFTDTKFNKTIFTDACFADASFVNCNLNRVNLVQADFRVRQISDTVVYGVSAWDLETSDTMMQSNLVIEKTYELYSDIVATGRIPMTVDDIELAQFIHFLLTHKKMRNVLDVMNSRAVLLLGAFYDGGLERLYRMRGWLRERNYMPIIFDFDRPQNLDTTETAVTVAGLSKMIIADLSGPSVPQELHAALTSFWRPVIVYSTTDPYSMFGDLERKQPFVARITYTDETDLYSKLPAAVEGAEAAHLANIEQLSARDGAAKNPPKRF